MKPDGAEAAKPAPTSPEAHPGKVADEVISKPSTKPVGDKPDTSGASSGASQADHGTSQLSSPKHDESAQRSVSSVASYQAAPHVDAVSNPDDGRVRHHTWGGEGKLRHDGPSGESAPAPTLTPLELIDRVIDAFRSALGLGKHTATAASADDTTATTSPAVASSGPGPLVVTNVSDVPADGEDHIIDPNKGQDDPGSQSGSTNNYHPGDAHDGGIHHTWGG